MKAILRLKEATGWNPESMTVCVGEEFETPIVRIHLTHIGYNKISDARISEIVHSILSAIDEIEFEVPGEITDYVGAKAPGWMSTGAGERVRVPRSGGGSAEIRIPPGAKYLANGEIEVPPRSDDGKSPDAKQFRRACRKARNAIRDLAASSGKTVELVMLELRGAGEAK